MITIILKNEAFKAVRIFFFEVFKNMSKFPENNKIHYFYF
jgi:hypothetical protein